MTHPEPRTASEILNQVGYAVLRVRMAWIGFCQWRVVASPMQGVELARAYRNGGASQAAE
ncbi:MAG: hypothetical protein Rubg2KO_34890 [Rubricoccaceae bacterium]